MNVFRSGFDLSSPDMQPDISLSSDLSNRVFKALPAAQDSNFFPNPKVKPRIIPFEDLLRAKIKHDGSMS